MTPDQAVAWVLSRTPADMRRLDRSAFTALGRATASGAADLDRWSAACRGLPNVVADSLIAHLRHRALVSLYVHSIRVLMDAGAATLARGELLARGLLYLQRPDEVLEIQGPAGQPLLFPSTARLALMDLSRWDEARALCRTAGDHELLDIRWASGALTRGPQSTGIRVVSLPSETYRRFTMRTRLRALGLSATLIAGVDAQALTIDAPPIVRLPTADEPPDDASLDPIVDGSFGNQLSMIRAMSTLPDGGVILEDDAFVWSAALSGAAQLLYAGPDLVFLQNGLGQRANAVERVLPMSTLLPRLSAAEPARRSWGAYGYVASRGAMDTLTAAMSASGITHAGFDWLLFACCVGADEVSSWAPSVARDKVQDCHRRGFIGTSGRPLLTGGIAATPLLEHRPFGSTRATR